MTSFLSLPPQPYRFTGHIEDECLHHSKDLAVTEPVSKCSRIDRSVEADGQKVEVEWSDLHFVPVSARSP